VYIILLHPEKNMRLTKQVKAQANSLKFASQMPTNTEFVLNHHSTNKVIVNNDGQSKSVVSNNTEENSQLLISTRTVTFENSSNNLNNSNEIIDNHIRKVPTIIMTSHSEGCLNDEKQKLSIKRYNYDDEDSLNSNSIQDEHIML
jgi:hypothetical protein